MELGLSFSFVQHDQDPESDLTESVEYRPLTLISSLKQVFSQDVHWLSEREGGGGGEGGFRGSFNQTWF